MAPLKTYGVVIIDFNPGLMSSNVRPKGLLV